MRKKYNFPVVVEGDEDGYFVSCPTLQGCYSCGDSYEDAMRNIGDAIRLHIQDIHPPGQLNIVL
ncbi:MAG: type II toxin-antitoxin system HicB family antitoxin [Candidatus Altiarchaeota archaeon]